MEQFKQQKITELQKKLVKEMERLKEEIIKLPAYVRRKKDEKNWEIFLMAFALAALVGAIIFGVGGWMAVALSGTLLALITVESGLVLSIAIGFSAWPLYNAYLWIRDLFSSEKIKNQNKDYDQSHKNLIELKELAAAKHYLTTKIDIHLKNAIQYFPSILSGPETDFAQLGLKDQIQRLKQQKKKFPAHIRKQKDKQIWSKIFQYSAMISCASLALYAIIFIMMAGVATSSILLGPLFPALVIIEAIVGLLIVGPVTVSSVLYTSYLGIRNLFSSAEVKNENKEYAQFEKVINKLKKLDEQQIRLDEKVRIKLECVDGNLAQTTHKKEIVENHSENPKNGIDKYLYRLFQEPAAPANQTIVAANLSSAQRNLI